MIASGGCTASEAEEGGWVGVDDLGTEGDGSLLEEAEVGLETGDGEGTDEGDGSTRLERERREDEVGAA
jgi:hypothetical protein